MPAALNITRHIFLFFLDFFPFSRAVDLRHPLVKTDCYAIFATDDQNCTCIAFTAIKYCRKSSGGFHSAAQTCHFEMRGNSNVARHLYSFP